MYKILVPTDFSEPAEYGLDAALKIAEYIKNAEIHLINFIQPGTEKSFSATGDLYSKRDEEEIIYIKELKRKNLKRLNHIIKDNNLYSIEITTKVILMDFENGLEGYVNANHIDLVVMGTSGEESFSEFFVGNHTQKVIKAGVCPVLSLKEPIDHFKADNIVLATDLNNDSHDAVKNITRFASYFNAIIHIVHVTTNIENKLALESKLEEFAHHHEINKNYTINVVEHDNKEKAINRFAQDKGADIIAVLAHGKSALANLFIGSVSQDLVKGSNMPVLTVHLD
jgi:nucleotide-binding universal stress UspA family protein